MMRKHIVPLVMLFLLLISSTALAAYQRTADNTVPAYRDAALTQRTGNERVDKGDVVTVFQETDKAYYVRYPVRNGTKDRWVPKNIFNSNPQPQQTSHNPEGWFDSVVSNASNQITVRGWTLDRDNVNEKLRVHVYIGGPAGSGEGHEIYANTYRPDVNRALGSVGDYHGFEATINTKRTGNQPVYVYGINIGGGENKELSQSPLRVDIKGTMQQEKVGWINTQSKNLNLRATPNGQIIGKLAKGTQVTVLETGSNGWTKVRTASGQVGYVASQYVSFDKLQDNRQQLMASKAREYIGSNKYNGYCQKFVRVVGEGIGLPSGNAASALDACNKWRVSTDRNIPIGAAVYLRGRNKATNGYKYGHVGIYVGNGNVIHALTTVKEQSLDSLLQSFDYLGWGWQAGVDLR